MSQSRHLNEVNQSKGMTTMDTNTNVTNSPLAVVNPTAVPCNKTQPNHVIQPFMASRPVHMVINASGIPAVMETYVHGNRSLVAHYPIQQTLPKDSEQTLQPKLRPVLIANNSQATQLNTIMNNNNLIHSVQQNNNAMHKSGQTYQMIAYPRQALKIVQSQPQKINQQSQKVSCNANNNMVLTGLVTSGTINSDSINTARIAQLLAPGGTNANSVGNAQILVYYPQNVVNTVKSNNEINTTVSANDHPVTISVTTTTHSQTQQPTLYYAVATNDLLRQFKLNQNAQADQANVKPQLLQTPSGLLLIQTAQVNTTQAQQNETQRIETPVPTNIAAVPAVVVSTGYAIKSNLISDSGTFPRQPKMEQTQSSGLICTCPPEVHQALFEQQNRQRQLNQSSDNLTGGILLHSKLKDYECSSKNCHEKHEYTDVNLKKLESTSNQLNQIINNSSSSVTANESAQHKRPNHSNQNTTEDLNENESHINYLITLFQALKNSGVQTKSFLEAFERIDEQGKTEKTHHKQVLDTIQTEHLKELREAVNSLYKMYDEFKRRIMANISESNHAINKLLNLYKANFESDLDPALKQIQNERLKLERSLNELNDVRSALGTQLHDLECIIEQIGNDVLQHRCHITLPHVQSMESRLESISSVGLIAYGCCPDLKQQLLNHEQTAHKAIEIEKRLIDEQAVQLKEISDKCKRIKGTIMTLKRLAVVNSQNKQHTSSPRRFAHLGGFVNRAAADRGSIERSRLYSSIRTIQPNSEKRLQAIKRQEILGIQKRSVLSYDYNNPLQFTSLLAQGNQKRQDSDKDIPPKISQNNQINNSTVTDNGDNVNNIIVNTTTTTTITNITTTTTNNIISSNSNNSNNIIDNSNNSTPVVVVTDPLHSKQANTNQPNQFSNHNSSSPTVSLLNQDKRVAPLALYSDDSLGSTATVSTIDSYYSDQTNKASFNPATITSMMDDVSDSTIENYSTSIPQSILKTMCMGANSNSPKQRNRSRGVMFNTTVTVDDGSEFVRLNCTLDDSELNKNKVPPTEKLMITSPIAKINPPRTKLKPINSKLPNANQTSSMGNPASTINEPISTTFCSSPSSTAVKSNTLSFSTKANTNNTDQEKVIQDTVDTSTTSNSTSNATTNNTIAHESNDNEACSSTIPAPPPRRTSQISISNTILDVINSNKNQTQPLSNNETNGNITNSSCE